MSSNMEIGTAFTVEIEEEAPDGDLEYAPVEISIEDIDFEIEELELDIKALREKREKLAEGL